MNAFPLTGPVPEPPDGPGLWIWPNVIRRGALTLLDGDPGVGKSLLTIDLAARVTRGRAWPDGSPGGPPGNVVVFNGDDARNHTVVPRLVAAGADLGRVIVAGTPDDPSGPMALPRDETRLADCLAAARPDLVVFDPLSVFVPAIGDTLRGVTLLVRMAAAYRTAIMPVRHLGKEERRRAIHRGLGSVGIIGAARTGLLAAVDPADPTRRILVPTKSNLAVPPPGLAYRVGQVNGRAVVDWLGPTPATADEALRGLHRGREGAGLVMATDWLLRLLEQGGQPARDVLTAATAAGISERTLDRAKAAVRARARIVMRDGRRAWLWELPGQDAAR